MYREYHRKEELLNKRIGLLTLTEFIEKMNNTGRIRIYWRCKCDCGMVIIRRQDYLLSKKGSKTCEKCQNRKVGKRHSLWKGIGDISGGQIASLKSSAKKRGIEFNLTKEYVWDLFKKQDGKCALSGLSIHFHQGTIRTKTGQQTASLDRKDNSLGYVEGNVHWVHKVINQMKNHFTEEIFIMACNAVAKTHPMETDLQILDESKATRNSHSARKKFISPQHQPPMSTEQSPDTEVAVGSHQK